jgi:flagellar assembly protein FliH
MSLSNVIKDGQDIAYSISAFDPDSIDSSPEEQTPDGPKGGKIKLPGGPSPRPRMGSAPATDESPDERLARLEREAYEKGFEQGRKDGLALEQKQIEEQKIQMETLFSEFQGLKSVIFRDTEEDFITLCKLISRRIVREEVRTDPAVIKRTVRAALDYVADRTHLKICINPEDMEEVRRILPELASLSEGGTFQVVEDDAIEKGGCTMETGFGKINATVSDQCSTVEKVIDTAFNTVKQSKA